MKLVINQPVLPEIEFLLGSCRSILGTAAQGSGEVPSGAFDESRLLSLAESHKVLPVFYQAMAVSGWVGISEETRGQVIRLYSANVIRSQKAIRCLQRIVEVLDQNKIEYMTFKGPELSETIYKDPHLRSFVDIDLLVPRQNALDAIDGLKAAGFEPGIKLSKETLPTYVHWEHFLPLVDAVSGTHVELHWELTGHYGAKPVEMDSLMTERALLLDQEVCVPKAEVYLVYLCLHGSHHRWEKIDSICCVAGLIRQRPDLDWGLVLEVAEDWRCRRDLFLGLFLVKTFMGLTFSEDMDKQIRDDAVVSSLNARGGGPME